jgi:hypothetical protein
MVLIACVTTMVYCLIKIITELTDQSASYLKWENSGVLAVPLVPFLGDLKLLELVELDRAQLASLERSYDLAETS